MAPPSAFFVQLDQQNAVYFSGSVLAGVVVLHNEQTLSTRGVRLEFSGVVETRIAQHQTVHHGHGHNMHHNNMHVGHSTTHTHTRVYTGETTLFRYKETLWGNPETGILVSASELSPGQRTYPFRFTIPQAAPASFQSSYGHGNIKYQIRAWVDRSWKSDYVAALPITIHHPLNFNLVQSYMQHTAVEHDRAVGCWIWSRGNIHTRMVLPRAVYTWDEIIPVQIQFANGSSRLINQISLTLIRNETYTAQGHQKVDSIVVATHLLTSTVSSQPDVVTLSTTIPLNTLTVGFVPSIYNVNLIKVEYKLKLRAHVHKGCPIELSFPLLIGTMVQNCSVPVEPPKSLMPAPQEKGSDSYNLQIEQSSSVGPSMPWSSQASSALPPSPMPSAPYSPYAYDETLSPPIYQ